MSSSPVSQPTASLKRWNKKTIGMMPSHALPTRTSKFETKFENEDTSPD